jgi:catechol-2,3-dioxygenase
MAMANHTSWRVESEAELLAWQSRLEQFGIKVSQFVRHEIIESVYFRDPNFYPLEISRPMRAVETIDAADAEMTIEAALKINATGRWTSIEQLWRTKAELVREKQLAGHPISI